MPQPKDLESAKRADTDVPVNDLILRRWSPRAFDTKPVSNSDLTTLFTAASWAASSYNEQPWRFLVGRKGDDTWTKIFNSLMPLNQGWTKDVPVLYAALLKKTFTRNGTPNRVAAHDVGAACATLSIQATALGLHTHGMGGFDPEAIRTAFGVPEDFDAISCWALGYFGDPDSLAENYRSLELQPRTRKSLPEFVFSGWDQPAQL